MYQQKSYNERCDEEIPWDVEAPEHLIKNKFVKWVRDPASKVPRSVALSKKSITAVDIHLFSDASIVASSEVVH